MKINSNFFKTINGIKTNVRLLENIREYLEVIEYLTSDFDSIDLWYRGISHVKYELIPRVYRLCLWKSHEDCEWWIYTDFTNKARSFIPNHHNYSEWDWYFTMQHYGLPTRLLDWTEGSLIGLYFAVRQPEHTHTPSVYVLNPYWFDEVVHSEKKGEGLIYSTDPTLIPEEHKDRLSSYLGSRRESPRFPLCLQPPAVDPRITVQKSVFTIHGKHINAFRLVGKRNKNPQIAKIRFSTKSAACVKERLGTMGITESTLFPDLEGLSRDLKWQRGIE